MLSIISLKVWVKLLPDIKLLFIDKAKSQLVAMSTENTSQYFRAAKTLNILINIVIAMLLLFLILFIIVGVLAHFDPGFEDVLKESDKSGMVTSVGGLMAGGILGGSIILAAYLYVAFVVRAIVKTTVRGNPFVSENISRLRKTWIIIALAEIVRMLASIIFNNGAANSVSSETVIGVEIRLQAWILVLFIAIMAEVFRIGLELRRDQELTV